LQLKDTPSCNQQATNVATENQQTTQLQSLVATRGTGRRAYRRAEGMLLWGGVLGVLGALVGQSLGVYASTN
jgi:hypothetical protein